MMFSWSKAKMRVGGMVAVLGAAALLSACGSSSSNSSAQAANSSPAYGAGATGSSSTASTVSIGTAKGSDGTYLVGPGGRALYLWVADASGKSSCSGACAQTWPPLVTKSNPRASHGVNASDLGTIKRSGGAKQVTYMGHPLYYYAADTKPGAVTGQGSDQFGAKWWLVAPSGSAITTAGASSTASSGSSGSSSSTSSSGGWG